MNSHPIFVDTHAHLDDGRFDRDLDAVLTASARSGVQRIVNIGYRPLRWQTTIALAERRPDVSYTLGLHPHHAEEYSPDLLMNLERLLDQHSAVALGEIGLDYFRDFADRDAQRHAFAGQLELAVRKRLPVVIHLRGEVEQDLVRELDRAPADLVCLLHSFDGSEELARYARDRGFIFGVGGLATREANTRLREIVASLPADRFVLETDAPYLTPAGVKDRRNSPINIPVIAAAVAKLRGASVAEIAKVTTSNAIRVFALPAIGEPA